MRVEHRAYPMRMSALGVSGSAGAGAGVPGPPGLAGAAVGGGGHAQEFREPGTFVKLLSSVWVHSPWTYAAARAVRDRDRPPFFALSARQASRRARVFGPMP